MSAIFERKKRSIKTKIVKRRVKVSSRMKKTGDRYWRGTLEPAHRLIEIIKNAKKK